MLHIKKNRGNILARWLLLLNVSLAFSVPTHSAEVPSKLIPKLKPFPACPALILAAQTNCIPIGQMDLPSAPDTNTLHPGDSVTVLATFVQKENQTQWLLYIEATTPDPNKKPEEPSSVTVTSSFGPPITYESKLVPAKLRFFGPFQDISTPKQTKPGEQDALFSLNENFLSLGFDQAAAVLWRWSQTAVKATIRADIAGSTEPASSKAPSSWKPTLAEQQAISSQFPALLSYVDIVQHTKGLDDLLFKLVKKPSLWSVIRHLGMKADISFGNGLEPTPANPADWNLPASAAAYYYPWLLRFNGQPALKITLVVTSPRPLLLICGGVIGVLAEKVGDDETYMTMRVVSAHKE
jgi:hypothetical protein